MVAKEFTTTLQNKNWGTQSKFLVIQGKMDSLPLPSKSTLLELGMLKIDPEGTIKDWLPSGKNTGKKIEVKLEMETDAKPVAQKPCPVPYHLQKPLARPGNEGDIRESPRWRGNYLVFTTSGSAQTKVHRN